MKGSPGCLGMWSDAIISRNIEAIINGYAPDAVQLQANIPVMNGREEIRGWYRTWLYDTAGTYSASTVMVDIAQSGELAYERSIYRFSQSTTVGHVIESGKSLLSRKCLMASGKL